MKFGSVSSYAAILIIQVFHLSCAESPPHKHATLNIQRSYEKYHRLKRYYDKKGFGSSVVAGGKDDKKPALILVTNNSKYDNRSSSGGNNGKVQQTPTKIVINTEDIFKKGKSKGVKPTKEKPFEPQISLKLPHNKKTSGARRKEKTSQAVVVIESGKKSKKYPAKAGSKSRSDVIVTVKKKGKSGTRKTKTGTRKTKTGTRKNKTGNKKGSGKKQVVVTVKKKGKSGGKKTKTGNKKGSGKNVKIVIKGKNKKGKPDKKRFKNKGTKIKVITQGKTGSKKKSKTGKTKTNKKVDKNRDKGRFVIKKPSKTDKDGKTPSLEIRIDKKTKSASRRPKGHKKMAKSKNPKIEIKIKTPKGKSDKKRKNKAKSQVDKKRKGGAERKEGITMRLEEKKKVSPRVYIKKGKKQEAKKSKEKKKNQDSIVIKVENPSKSIAKLKVKDKSDKENGKQKGKGVSPNKVTTSRKMKSRCKQCVKTILRTRYKNPKPARLKAGISKLNDLENPSKGKPNNPKEPRLIELLQKDSPKYKAMEISQKQHGPSITSQTVECSKELPKCNGSLSIIQTNILNLVGTNSTTRRALSPYHRNKRSSKNPNDYKRKVNLQNPKNEVDLFGVRNPKRNFTSGTIMLQETSQTFCKTFGPMKRCILFSTPHSVRSCPNSSTPLKINNANVLNAVRGLMKQLDVKCVWIELANRRRKDLEIIIRQLQFNYSQHRNCLAIDQSLGLRFVGCDSLCSLACLNERLSEPSNQKGKVKQTQKQEKVAPIKETSKIEVCPPGFVLSNDTCYYVQTNAVEKSSTNAKTCPHGSNLIAIKTDNVFSRVKELATDLKLNCVWTNMSYVNGSWTGHLEMKPKWANGHPKTEGLNGSACVKMSQNEGYKYVVTSCGDKCSTVCGISLKTPKEASREDYSDRKCRSHLCMMRQRGGYYRKKNVNSWRGKTFVEDDKTFWLQELLVSNLSDQN